jgi:curved DNA-binding protein CbpA
VRSAFRRLARTYHPDVAGRRYSRKFEQITKAYAFLKELPQEELPRVKDKAADIVRPARDAKKSAAQSNAAHRFSFRAFRGFFGKPFAWYRKKRESLGAEKERLRRAAEDARKKILLEKEARIDAALNRGERSVEDLMSRRERETMRVGTQGLALRLSSDNCQVRQLALTYLASLASLREFGELVNRPEIFEALFGMLQKWDIDEKTARMVSALKLNQENHRKLTRGLVVKAAVMPPALLSHLLRLHNAVTTDRELLELYLRHAGASGIALILRQWPQGAFVSEPALCRLISHENESVLVAIFSAMKQRSVPCPESGLERLHSHMSHPNMAVRAWAKSLLPRAVKNQR